MNFRTASDRTWALFGDHWPSRSGGQVESPRLRPFGGMGKEVDETGYSDHFPLSVTAKETD